MHLSIVTDRQHDTRVRDDPLVPYASRLTQAFNGASERVARFPPWVVFHAVIIQFGIQSFQLAPETCKLGLFFIGELAPVGLKPRARSASLRAMRSRKQCSAASANRFRTQGPSAHV